MNTTVSSRPPGTPHQRTTPRRWAAVAMLTASTFLVVTSEMLPVGVLTPMAQGLHITPGTAGYSLTITGIIAAVTAPVIPRLLGALDRRVLLATAMTVLAAGNALTATAHGLGLMILSRTVLGLGMGAVWGLAAAVAIRLVAPRNAALAVSFAIGGVAAASVIGVPLGTAIGNALGWRAAFATLAAGSLALAAALPIALPRLPRPAASPSTGTDTRDRPILRTPAVRTGLAVTALLVTAHFAAYTYVRPVLEERTGLAPDTIALALLVYGVFGLVGNFAAGALAARRARATVLVLAAGISAAILLLVAFGTALSLTGAAIALWGLAYGGLSVAGQLWMTQSAPHRVEHVSGLYVGVFTASIALGAFLGGTVVETAGITALLWSATALALAALLTGAIGRGPHPHPRRTAEPGPESGPQKEAATA